EDPPAYDDQPEHGCAGETRGHHRGNNNDRPNDDGGDTVNDEPRTPPEHTDPARVGVTDEVPERRQPDGRPALGAPAIDRQCAEVIAALAAGQVGLDDSLVSGREWRMKNRRWRPGGFHPR